jgi:hypothetical protein
MPSATTKASLVRTPSYLARRRTPKKRTIVGSMRALDKEVMLDTHY